MEPTNDDFDTWIVALTAAGKFIGRPVSDWDPDSKSPLEPLCLDPVYELQVNMIPMPQPGGRLALHREISALPFITTMHGAPLWIVPVALQHVVDMQPKDIARYKGLVEQAQRICEQQRAHDAGIHLAGQLPDMKPKGNA